MITIAVLISSWFSSYKFSPIPGLHQVPSRRHQRSMADDARLKNLTSMVVNVILIAVLRMAPLAPYRHP
jgi:hypothetical protein